MRPNPISSATTRTANRTPQCPGARFVSLLPANKRSLLRGLDRRSVVSDNIFNSNGIHVGVVNGAAIFDLDGQKLYDLKGLNIYRLSGELVEHLSDAHGSEKRLDRLTDKLFLGRGDRRT
jgi:hypothetical protein